MMANVEQKLSNQYNKLHIWNGFYNLKQVDKIS